MLKDLLISKNDLKIKKDELLQKCWYRGLKEDVFEEVKKCLFSECDYIMPTELQEIAQDIGCYFYDIETTDGEIFYNCITYSNIFTFIRSKLWNEGINLLTTIDGALWCVKIRKDEKYNDTYIIPITKEDFMSLITECSYINNFSKIKQLYDDSVKQNKSDDVSKKKKNKKKKKDESNYLNSTDGNPDSHIIDNYINPSLLDLKFDNITTYSNGDYEQYKYDTVDCNNSLKDDIL